MSEVQVTMFVDLSEDAARWLKEVARDMEAELRKQEPEAIVTAETMAGQIIEHYYRNEIEVPK